MKKQIDSLIEIGLNNLEAEVYVYLLSHLPATAYKIGKDINKPTANVYKAIESLSKKGAVIIEDNNKKLCKAVAISEFISSFKNDIFKKASQAETNLAGLFNNTSDQNTYQINSVPLVFERFRSMLKRCKKIAVIDAFPDVLEVLINDIEDAAQHGINIFIETYKPINIKNVETACTNVGEKNIKHWNSQQLNIIIDGEEHLIALLDNSLSNVIQATWSNNVYMSCMLHAGFLREHTMVKIQSEYDSPDFENKVKSILDSQRFFYNSDIPGFNKLFNIK